MKSSYFTGSYIHNCICRHSRVSDIVLGLGALFLFFVLLFHQKVSSFSCAPLWELLLDSFHGPSFSSVAYLEMEDIHTCTASQNMPWSLSILQPQGTCPLYTFLFVSLRPALHLHCIQTSHSTDRKAARSLQGGLYKYKISCLLENISGSLLIINMKLMKVN